MDQRTVDQYRTKAEQWNFAKKVVQQMRREQGDGELNFTIPPAKMPSTSLQIKTVSDTNTVKTIKNRQAK